MSSSQPLKKKFRKRQASAHIERSADSAVFRSVRDNIYRRKFPEALALLEGLAAANPGPRRKGRILALLGDLSAEQGKFDESVSYHKKSTEFLGEHPALWIRAAIGEVTANLKNDAPTEALAAASACLQIARSKDEAYAQSLVDAAATVKSTGRAELPQRPPSACSVATRLGALFLNAGEPSAARYFFGQAVEARPDGASSAKAGLAKLALSEGKHQLAYDLARQSIMAGNFRASTIAAWATLLAAKRALGLQGLDEELVAGLEVGLPRVSARANLLVIRSLEAEADPEWEAIAEGWLSRAGESFPVVAAEIRKIRLSRAKLAAAAPDDQIEAALELLGTPGLGFSEYLSASKELVRASLFKGKVPAIEEMVAEVSSLYGPDRAGEFRHGIALSCMMAKRHDLARPLLLGVIASSPRASEAWSKAVWALARMEKALGRHKQAANRFGAIKDNPKVPERFRAQAAIEWVMAYANAGEVEQLDAARPEIARIVEKIASYELLLDLSRNLRRVQGFGELSDSALARGTVAAKAAFEAEAVPEHAIDILFKLTRRQVLDHFRYQEAADYWEATVRTQSTWLWANKAEYWHYIGYIFRSYSETGRFGEAESLARGMIGDAGTPEEGRLRLQAIYGQGLVAHSRYGDALAIFEAAVAKHPTHAELAPAHYWLAISAYKRADVTSAKYHAEMLRRAVGNDSNQLQEWEYDSKARLLLAELGAAPITNQAVNYGPDFWERAKQSLQADLAKLAN